MSQHSRLEDARFLTGQGNYTADSNRSGQVFGRVVRSPHAHADIIGIDMSMALEVDGVLGIWSEADLAADGLGIMPCNVQAATDEPIIVPPRYGLARGRVRHVGEPVAFVVAKTEAAAIEAAELVDVDYDPLPSVVDSVEALKDGTVQLWSEAANNTAFRFKTGDREATESAFVAAAHVVELDIVNNRVSALPVEQRAGIAEYDPDTEQFTLELTGQGVHGIRRQLAQSVFKIDFDKVHLFAQDVGAGFGLKNFLFSEWILLLWSARKLGLPVKWIGDLGEDLSGSVHGRAINTAARLALAKDGRFLGLSVDLTADLGAYASGAGPNASTNASSTAMGGIYDIPAIYMESKGVFTNTAPVDAYRGAGKPEANFIIERLIDAAVHRHGFDPVDLRLLNAVDTFPYRKALGAVLDCGRYKNNIQTAVAAADRAGFAGRRAASKDLGKLRGLGVACFLESARGAPQEEAAVRFADDGKIELVTGTESNGQGHETTFTHIAAERLGLPIECFCYIQADTRQTRVGAGHGGARTMHMGAGTLAMAIDQVIEKGKSAAAQLLQVKSDDVTYVDGRYSVGDGSRTISLVEIAEASRRAEVTDLDTAVFREDAPYTFPGGCHIAEVEVDPDTGDVSILRYTAVDDYGNIVNPALTEGQVHGGLAQGIGQALSEEIVYDKASGQLLSGSLMDYAVPRAEDLPSFDVVLDGAPTEANPLGVKGAGQAGCISAPPAIVNAVTDALSPLGIDHLQMPLTAEKVWRAVQAAR